MGTRMFTDVPSLGYMNDVESHSVGAALTNFLHT